MNNTLSLLMLTALIGYLLFIVVKTNRYYYKKAKSSGAKHFEFAILGLFVGFFVGIFNSSQIVHLIFTDNFLERHQNSDIGLFGFYFLMTFILMCLSSMLSVAIYNVFYKNKA